jgi:peptidoglycan/xylan/chitin deacetylase (PgdA/CDA1 family)
VSGWLASSSRLLGGLAAVVVAAAVAVLLLGPVPPKPGHPTGAAVSTRALWPHPLRDAAAFDAASRLEILASVQALAALEHENLPAFLSVKTVNGSAVAAWKARARRLLTANFAAANAGCHEGADVACAGTTTTTPELEVLATRFQDALPDTLRPWYDDARDFHRGYLYEQLRRAAMFPAPASEALTFDDSEITGFELPDRTFLLTFDDGPTPEHGTTDDLVAALARAKVNGLFFALGDALGARIAATSADDVRALYANECVASHSRTHDPDADWQGSVAFTDALLRSTFPALADGTVMWRPPYGRRTADAATILSAKRSRVVLWNLDSQDWNPHIDAGQITNRMVSLMLLWRRGILLFHDVHAKAAAVVPALVRTFGPAVRWQDCNAFPST